VHPDGRVRDRYGRLPRRKRNLTASVYPELHEAATAAIRASGLSTSDWIAEAIQLRLEVDAELGRRAG
jgi:predicted HicB family RNase H-like nuclease